MFMRSCVVALVMVQPAFAGYYSKIDAPEETRYSRDYENVFGPILYKLRCIPAAKVLHDPHIRRRYVLIETLARDGKFKLDTLEQKLNYSAVLIRRNRADDAMQFLLPLTKDHPRNFVLMSQYGTACFLSNNPDFTSKAPDLMKHALELWPKSWNDLEEDQRKFLESFGWDETAFDRYRRYETYFERLVRNRLREEARLKKKLTVEETVDPIFIDEQNKPIRFVNDMGKFEASQIAAAAKKNLPRDAVEAVEQLLIWMPNDQRLLWLLGEVFNASAMDYQDQRSKDDATKSAFAIFASLVGPQSSNSFGRKEIQSRHGVLETYVKSIPPLKLPIPD